jgi:hypothetical protein
MYDRVTNKYSFEMNERPITLASLIPKQIYEEQLKLKKEKMIQRRACISGGPSLLTRFFLVLMTMLFFSLN